MANPPSSDRRDDAFPAPVQTGAAYMIYFLYIASIFTGLPMLLGVIVAYVYRGSGVAWLETHYRYQIRTFWLLLFYSFLSVILAIVLFPLTFLFLAVGFHLWVVLAIWIGLRCLVGLRDLGNLAPVRRPGSWLV